MSDPSTPTAPSSESIMVDDIVELVSNAVELDKAGELQAAVYYYLESAKALEQVGQRLDNAQQYRRRAAELLDIVDVRKQEEGKFQSVRGPQVLLHSGEEDQEG